MRTSHLLAGFSLLCLTLLTTACGLTEPEQVTQDVTCGHLYFARDPANNTCRPLVACSADDGPARAWKSCANPCVDLDEAACAADVRCQRVFDSEVSFNQPTFVPDAGPPGSGGAPDPGSFHGCRPVPTPATCEQLSAADCGSNPTCEVLSNPCECVPGPPSAGPDGALLPRTCITENCSTNATLTCRTRSCVGLGAAACQDRGGCTWDGATCRAAAARPCASLGEADCLGRRDCRANGSLGYCPSDMSCGDSNFGGFTGCADDAPTAGCRFDSDCALGFTCDLGGVSDLGAASGRCIPLSGCSNLPEGACTADPRCMPKYAERCPPPLPGQPQQQPSSGGYDPNAPVGGPLPPSECLPVSTFVSCVELSGNEIVPDRSLLVLDPVALSDPQYSFANMMGRLVPGGDASRLYDQMLATYSQRTPIGTSVAEPRGNFTQILSSLHAPSAQIPLTALHFRPVAIVNRLDLLSAHDCGEARIVYSSDLGSVDRGTRMTIIFEFGVPNDGQGCKTVAHHWLALSQMATGSVPYRDALRAITDELFQGPRLNQLRTDELMLGRTNPMSPAQVKVDWELREFKLVNGVLVPGPCKNSPRLDLVSGPEFMQWVGDNQIGIALGQVTVPEAFLAPTSISDGNRVQLPVAFRDAESKLNANTCNGCHSTETNTAFVHIAEPSFSDGRARPSRFLQAELPKRAETLRLLLGDSAQATVLRTRPRPPVTH